MIFITIIMIMDNPHCTHATLIAENTYLTLYKRMNHIGVICSSGNIIMDKYLDKSKSYWSREYFCQLWTFRDFKFSLKSRYGQADGLQLSTPVATTYMACIIMKRCHFNQKQNSIAIGLQTVQYVFVCGYHAVCSQLLAYQMRRLQLAMDVGCFLSFSALVDKPRM